MLNSLKRTALKHLPVLENAKVLSTFQAFYEKRKYFAFLMGKKYYALRQRQRR